MDISKICLPIDLPQTRPFRQLREALGDFNAALSAWYLLYQDLRYRQQDGQPAGRIPLCEENQLLQVFELVSPDEGVRRKIIAVMEEAGVLRRDGEEWLCLRFISMHAGTERTTRDVSRMGGHARSFALRQRKLNSFQQSLGILPDKFVDQNGEPLPPELVERVTRLIITCDNALALGDRPEVAFTEGLIQTAAEVCLRLNDEQIMEVARTVAIHRDHPRLAGMTTERLLPDFEKISREINSQ